MKRHTFLVKQRLRVGLSQADVAAKLGYSAQLISLWEKGKAVPDLSVASAYASILKVDLTGFVNCKNHHTNSNCDNHIFDIEQFATYFRFLRKNKKLLQSEIAKKCKTNIKTISSWENGFSTPSIDNFKKLCLLFHVSFDQFYFGNNKNIQPVPLMRKKIVIPIFVPTIVLVCVGGAGTGVAIQMNANRKAEHTTPQLSTSVPTSSPASTSTPAPTSTSLEHVHIFSKTTLLPTFEADGKTTYVCDGCGYSYEETIPHLEHNYDPDWTCNKHYHYHKCLDDGYEHLVSNKEEHSFSGETIGLVTTYTCSECGYSFDTSDDIAVLDIYSESNNLIFSMSNPEDFFVKVLNPSKHDPYSSSYIIEMVSGGDGLVSVSSGALLLSEVDEDFTIFRIPSTFFLGISFIQYPDTVFDFYFNHINSKTVTCDKYRITVID